MAEALRRSGEPCFSESQLPNREDPNYVGSASNVNNGKYNPDGEGKPYAWTAEIHFDYRDAPEGGFGLYYSSSGKAMADAIRARFQEFGLPVRGNTERTDLYFLKNTKPPAILWETNKTRAHSEEEVTARGEAIAAGLCDWIGKTLNPSIKYVPRTQLAPPPSPPDCSQVEAERDQARAEAANQKTRADSAEAKLAQAKQKAGEIGAL